MSKKLPVGTVINDAYEVTGYLGSGGFARVYEATQLNIGRTVALKLLHSKRTEKAGEENIARFMREARAIASIEHPNVVTIYDVGLLPPHQPYIVMQPFKGDNLRVVLNKEGPQKPSRILPLFVDCLDALALAHQQGIIHRDLKPDNLILTNPGERREALKIVDFGIARLECDQVNLTNTGRRVGTPKYLSPEYLQDQVVVPALDVYQMGLILVEMLSGEQVVKSENPFQAALQHMERSLELPLGLLEGPLGSIILKALCFDHTQRYPTAAEFRDAIDGVEPGQLDGQKLGSTVKLKDVESGLPKGSGGGGGGAADPDATVVGLAQMEDPEPALSPNLDATVVGLPQMEGDPSDQLILPAPSGDRGDWSEGATLPMEGLSDAEVEEAARKIRGAGSSSASGGSPRVVVPGKPGGGQAPDINSGATVKMTAEEAMVGLHAARLAARKKQVPSSKGAPAVQDRPPVSGGRNPTTIILVISAVALVLIVLGVTYALLSAAGGK